MMREGRMTKRVSSRFLFALLLVFIVLIIGVVLAVALAPTRADITIVWQVSTTSFTHQDQQDIQSALKSALLTSNSGQKTSFELSIIDAQRQGNWAIFSAIERVNHNAQSISREPVFFFAHQLGTTWTIRLPSSSNFCNELNHIPATLLDATDKGYFC